ncbi:putative rNA polymerase sigma-70 factor [Lyngbya aestuarii BL J]|uniref:Putative rNA polymerase sigma-70 factor n=1 Tax=Lyngbya aestuarii BL J TaxID=1348334 RepID=U7QF87_9CYAN|nr:hypothetical protein [Lyngbya aestuarii]ERT05111.1 putative rNA polymerase sigma-70 factor [Lyngbya aestuarii BL J]
MSKLPTNDQALINFLKQNRPTAPEATSDLEERIIAAIDTDDPVLSESISTHPSVATKTLRLVSSLIAVGLTLFWMGYRLVSSSSLSPSEQSQLEGFIESNWNGAMEETQETSWLTIPDNSQD